MAGLRQGTIPVESPSGRMVLGGYVVVAVDGAPYLDWVRSGAPRHVPPGARHVLLVTVMRAGVLFNLPISVIHRPQW